ncbi:MbcA/ParS/Xre antitoxin family protein [Deinococcus depolymerans]|uniref:Antitoxin Xre/MbcA/ParS-like toxin-binding domain-containing protein n=1 Tax=Deinococcus depolymerans TaxID=392408 RepID=A0ABN1CQS2_9DEIO
MYGLNVKDMALIIGRDPSGLARWPDSAGVQEALVPLEALAVRLRAYFGSMEVSRMWLQAPNPALGSEVPISRLRAGKVKTVQRLLLMAQTGMPV